MQELHRTDPPLGNIPIHKERIQFSSYKTAGGGGGSVDNERIALEVLKNIDRNIAMLGTIVQDLLREDNLGRLTRFNSFVSPEKLPESAIERLNGFRDGTKENSDHGVSKDNE